MNSYLLVITIVISCIIYSNGQAVETVVMPYAQPITINCTNVTGGSWFLHNITANTITPITTHDKFTVNSDKSLTITNLRSAELTAEYICNSSSGSVTIKPRPQPYMYAREKSSITVTEGGYTSLLCKMIVGFHQNQTIQWTWKLNNEVLTESESRVKFSNSGINNSTSELTLRQISSNDKGIITCTVDNGNGNYTQEIQLRVKNTLAALWPFLAIIGEVIILCIIILVFEKKCAKKSTTNEDEAENLMSKPKDNNNSELKKRPVKA